MSREERLKEVYEYVRSHYPIHTQAEFADFIKYNRAYISSAMHGNEKNLTDKLFTTICEAFHVFNLDYLLTGRGELTLPENKKDVTQISDSRNVTQDSHLDISSVINAIIAAKDAVIAEKDKRLAEKDEYIASLKSEIKHLQRTIAEHNFDSLKNYPFQMGAAEPSEAHSNP